MKSKNQLNRRNFLRYTGALISTGTLLSACGGKETVEPTPMPMLNSISCWGDSLTAGSGGRPYAEILQERMPNRVVKHYAIGGQQAYQVSARQGGRKIEITVEGNAFRGTEMLTISPISVKFLTNGNTGERRSKGKVASVACEIIRYCENEDIKKEIYALKPLEASTVEIPAKSIFIPDEAEESRKNVTILWMGRNDTPRFIPNDVIKSFELSVEFLEQPAKFIILGILNAIDEPIGSDNYNSINATNEILMAKFPNNFIPTTPPTEQEAKDVDYVFTEQDKVDISNGCFPKGLLSDHIHFTVKGYTIIANRIEAFLKKNPTY